MGRRLTWRSLQMLFWVGKNTWKKEKSDRMKLLFFRFAEENIKLKLHITYISSGGEEEVKLSSG